MAMFVKGASFFLAGLLLGCGSSQSTRVDDGAPVEPAQESREQRDETSAPNELSSELERYCEIYTTTIGEMLEAPSGAILLRLNRTMREQGLEERLASLAVESTVLMEFFREFSESRPRGNNRNEIVEYTGMVEHAGERGVPDYRCEPLHRLAWLRTPARQRVGPPPRGFEGQPASPTEDLGRVCDIATELTQDAEFEGFQVINAFHLEIFSQLTNDLVWDVFANSDRWPPEERYPEMERALREIAQTNGLDGWNCPLFREIWRANEQ